MKELHSFRESVVWADGTRDSKRVCDECGLDTCKYPVHTDYYKEIVSKKAQSFSDEDRVSETLSSGEAQGEEIYG